MAKSFASGAPRRTPKAELQAGRSRHNSNVSNILPLTTFKTIDLGGKKISGPLFSGFWTETRDFLEGKIAPKIGQLKAQVYRPLLYQIEPGDLKFWPSPHTACVRP